MGATRYVAAITDEEFEKIAANVNTDMLASPNHANFVYDGDLLRHPAVVDARPSGTESRCEPTIVVLSGLPVGVSASTFVDLRGSLLASTMIWPVVGSASLARRSPSA